MQRRCRIVLDAAKAGATVNGISRKYGMDNHGVKLWLRRYIQGGFANLGDAHRSGRPCVYDYEDITAKIAVYTVLKPHVLGVSTKFRIRLSQRIIRHSFKFTKFSGS